MIKYTKNFTPLFITPLLLSACGGGGGENTNIYTLESTLDQDVISSTQISGTAVKGVIKKGKVSAYGFVNGQINDLPLATSYTDSQGRYSLVIDNYNGPLFIEVSANSDTTMTCDIIDGCNGFLFSEDIPLDDEFNLKTAIPLDGSKAEIIANATVITTLAAELAEKYNSVDEIVIQNANTHVANLLKINGDITNIDTIDIFKPSPTISLDSEAKETSILNSALISAALKKNNQNKTISDALNLLIDEFIKNDGQMMNHLEDGRQSITLSNIFDEALEMVNHPALNHSALNTTKGNFLTLKEFSRLNPGELTNISPNELQKMNDVDTAKHMITKLKQLHQQFTKENSQLPSAVAQLNLVSSFSSDKNFQALSLLIKKASRGFLSAFDANKIELEQNNIPLDQYVYTEIDGSIFPIDIMETEDGSRYQIDSSIALSETFDYEINYNLIAKVSATEPEVETTYSDRRIDYFDNPHDLPLDFDDERQTETTFSSASARNNINYELNISGELISPHYNLKILDGDVDARKYVDLSAWFNGGTPNSQEYIWGPEDQPTPLLYREVTQSDDVAVGEGLTLNLDLNIEANQVNYDNPIAFMGKMSIDGNNHDTYALYDRCMSSSLYTEELPILALGLNSEDCITSNDPIQSVDNRPLIKDDLVITGENDDNFIKLSGELKQSKNSVKGIFASSRARRQDSWGSISEPGDLNEDFTERTSTEGFFDMDIEALASSAVIHPVVELDDFAFSTPVLPSEIILNNQDPSFVTTLKDLLQLDTFSTAKYEDDLTNEANDINRQFFASSNHENMLALAVKLPDESISDIKEINITKSNAFNNKNYSMDIEMNSEHLDFDISYHDILNELTQVGSHRDYFEEYLAVYPEYEYGQPFLSKGEHPLHDFLYDRDRSAYQIPKLTVTNQNDTILQLFEICPELVLNCEQMGTIKVKGNTVGHITYDYTKNNYIVNFNDGTSEIL
jgi:hypothetical protein